MCFTPRCKEMDSLVGIKLPRTGGFGGLRGTNKCLASSAVVENRGCKAAQNFSVALSCVIYKPKWQHDIFSSNASILTYTRETLVPTAIATLHSIRYQQHPHSIMVRIAIAGGTGREEHLQTLTSY